jgi:hypothetical protein
MVHNGIIILYSTVILIYFYFVIRYLEIKFNRKSLCSGGEDYIKAFNYPQLGKFTPAQSNIYDCGVYICLYAFLYQQQMISSFDSQGSSQLQQLPLTIDMKDIDIGIVRQRIALLLLMIGGKIESEI